MRVLGLDLSLRATGMAIVPSDWGLNWSRVTVGKLGFGLPKDAPEAERIRRLRLLQLGVVQFAQTHRPDVVLLEQYAFSAMVSQAHALGELGGAVKCGLVDAGYPVEVVSPARARTLLGKAPRKGAKHWAALQLTRAGAPQSWSLDVCDAFVVANWKLSALGSALVMRAAA